MKIHLNSRNGIYEVVTYGRNSITLSTKHNSFSVPTSDFKSFAGGIWNCSINPRDFALFLAVVRPDEYKLQVAQEDQILTLAARADRIKAEIDALPIAQVLSTTEIVDEFNSSDFTVADQHEEELYHQQQQDDEDDYAKYLEGIEREEAQRTPEKWNEMLAKKATEVEDMKDKLRDVASKVYSHKIDTSNIKVSSSGIKFIIQQNYNDKTYRFCWDPFGFGANYHSNISEMYRENGWGTMNGGWIKIIDNDVILYYKSGDYGVYDDTVAVECAKKVFPTKQVHSFAGQQWDEKLTSMFDNLPF
jgi:hypothetical protein